MKIAICIPCHGGPKFQFALDCLPGLLLQTVYSTLPQPWHLQPFPGESSDLPRNRNTIAGNALSWGADWVLWLDADHTFPPDALLRLIAHNAPLVAANYPMRSGRGDTVPAAARVNDERLHPRAEGGLEEAGTAGLGLCLMSADVLRAVKQPWFVGGTEDVFFFKRARAAGFPLMVDHDLEVGHITETVLRFPR